MKDHGLKPIGPMQVDDDVTETSDGLTQVVSFDITPDIVLPDLKDITVSIEDINVDDVEVEEELDTLRRRSGKYAELHSDDAVAKDDVITLSGTISAARKRSKTFRTCNT